MTASTGAATESITSQQTPVFVPSLVDDPAQQDEPNKGPPMGAAAGGTAQHDDTTTSVTVVDKSPSPQQQQHTSIVLFYRYFLPDDSGGPSLMQQHSDHYVPRLQQFAKDLCQQLLLKGRILIAAEGINGTVSACSAATLQQFMDRMEAFDLVRDLGPSPLPSAAPSDAAAVVLGDGDDPSPTNVESERLFQGIDWKLSHATTDHSTILEPFPDLKVRIVQEIISTGGTVSVQNVKEYTGKHLTPQEFHECLLHQAGNNNNNNKKKIVLIDVRNTFEHAIGHFVLPVDETPAVNPETVTFSSFDATFCATQAEKLKDCKVLMYCTGGIRCEKASCMLKQRGVQDVSQLSGGIHRYLETYGASGFFKGKNFVFDQRVAQKPSECLVLANTHSSTASTTSAGDVVVGRCIECQAPFDELCGSRVCTVCRDLVLVCETCQLALREYHCSRHATWKHSFYTFLDVFDGDELAVQEQALHLLRDTYQPAMRHKNVRRTLSRQIDKVARRRQALSVGEAVVDRCSPRRCRTCMETSDICDGRCWGFWKMDHLAGATKIGGIKRLSDEQDSASYGISKPDPVHVGDRVEVGPDWNELRLGSKLDILGQLRRGRVVEVKSWGSGGVELDCVAVCWEHEAASKQGKPRNTPVSDQPLIYRWGVLALNHQRMYDVQLLKE